ncbi:hypothetical protein FNF31_00264 [Cafeteria roenbergensis]|uniref:Uncharacterized protein n=1 Tax=Cafeteria roenbergensis TaxID=33653 RepID=A0A5A8DSF9_CAFRO|nr:hypothetical protein FNF28_03386 [Cafeteria roenbergensis]KAA0168382.1 hypothetical protein FNF31_00264 [Cafeteria roenbergensis]
MWERFEADMASLREAVRRAMRRAWGGFRPAQGSEEELYAFVCGTPEAALAEYLVSGAQGMDVQATQRFSSAYSVVGQQSLPPQARDSLAVAAEVLAAGRPSSSPPPHIPVQMPAPSDRSVLGIGTAVREVLDSPSVGGRLLEWRRSLSLAASAVELALADTATQARSWEVARTAVGVPEGWEVLAAAAWCLGAGKGGQAKDSPATVRLAMAMRGTGSESRTLRIAMVPVLAGGPGAGGAGKGGCCLWASGSGEWPEATQADEVPGALAHDLVSVLPPGSTGARPAVALSPAPGRGVLVVLVAGREVISLDVDVDEDDDSDEDEDSDAGDDSSDEQEEDVGHTSASDGDDDDEEAAAHGSVGEESD